MKKGLIVLALSLLFAVGLAAGCAGGNNSNGGNDVADSSTGGDGEASASSGNAGPGATTGKTDETPEATDPGGTTASPGFSGTTSGVESVSLEQISSGTMGPEKRQILVASSADELAAALGLRIPDSGEGTYVAVAWGEEPTGGYGVGFGTVRVEGVRLEVGVELTQPPQDAMVAQTLTYPYSVAVLRGVDLGEKELVLVAQNGRELGWSVFNV